MMKAFETNATRGEYREGPHLGSEFQGRSTCQRHDTPKTTRRSPLTPRISRMLHAPASRRAENNDRVATYVQNFEDAPRAGVKTRRKQREGRHLRLKFRRRPTRQRHDSRKATRRSPLTSRISRTLHATASRRARNSETLYAPASRCAENNEKVATYAQNFEDAPRGSFTTRGKQREGRHLRPEFRGRSTRQRHDAPTYRPTDRPSPF